MAGARAYNAWLLDRARPYLGRRVLDVGAGLGTVTEMLAQGRELVVALEPDPEFVQLLRERFAAVDNVRVVDADVTALGGDSLPGDFDSAVCLNVLEHLPDDVGVLRTLRQQVRPGGRLLLLVPAHPFLFGSLDRALGHERRYSERSLRALLEQAGLAVETLRHVNAVGAIGWLVSARVLKREQIPAASLRVYDLLVPLLRGLDRIELPIGLSLWAVTRRPGTSDQ
jgi:SAM-dependent methyltransferase